MHFAWAYNVRRFRQKNLAICRSIVPIFSFDRHAAHRTIPIRIWFFPSDTCLSGRNWVEQNHLTTSNLSKYCTVTSRDKFGKKNWKLIKSKKGLSSLLSLMQDLTTIHVKTKIKDKRVFYNVENDEWKHD